jgi:hypothetical protein
MGIGLFNSTQLQKALQTRKMHPLFPLQILNAKERIKQTVLKISGNSHTHSLESVQGSLKEIVS